ncbi:MAG TPA: hypothetical protein VFQ75_02945, partial [Candidatus Limnocylindrales bacterium]|nr:hypothetical protein [Candidatus Limnocylindrales bacterium]
LIEVLARPVPTPIGPVNIGAAVGIAVALGDGAMPPSTATLLVRAEQAMYLAKEDGAGASAWHVWSPEDRVPFGGVARITREDNPGA